MSGADMGLDRGKSRILIVDDSNVNLSVLSSMLLDHYDIKLASSGEKAWDILISETLPDLLLLDIMMPGMDGLTLCSRVKEKRRLQDIPVIFISGLDDPDDILKAFAVGGVDYITKPFQIEEVLARVDVHMDLRQSQKELQSLLSKTLTGSIHVMIELLSFSNPDIIKQSNRLTRYARAFAIMMQVDVKQTWIIDLSVMLSQIGCLSIPECIQKKKYSGAYLTSEEEDRFAQHPNIGADMISKIPRMEKVAAIIRNQLIPPSELGYAPNDIVYIGSTILNILSKADMLIMRGMSMADAVEMLKKQDPPYPDKYLDVLGTIMCKQNMGNS